MHFLHLTFRVRDIEKSLKFYTEFVGLKILRQEKTDQWEIAFLADKERATQIELVYMPNGDTIETKGLTVCFQTDDLDGVRQMAIEKDLNPSEIRIPDATMRYFYVYDPDRVSIEFKELKSES
ncbi:MAG: VOC family protein [Clostridiales bacterium]|nr:VOC family protein [Clostridiales bacterium]